MTPAIYLQMRKVEDTHWWFRALRALVVQEACAVLPDRSRARVLDVGCGTGGTVSALHELGIQSLVAADVGPLALSFTRDRGAGVVIGAATERLPFVDSCFDLVTALDVLSDGGVDEASSMAELTRVLRPGGWLLINVPAFHWLRGAHDRAVHTVRRYTQRSVSELIGRAGLVVHRMTYWNTTLVPALAAWRCLSRLWSRRRPGSDIWPVTPLLNGCLVRLVLAELQIRRWTELPWGSSIFVVATKRSAGAVDSYSLRTM